MKDTSNFLSQNINFNRRRVFLKQSFLLGSGILFYTGCATATNERSFKGTILKQDIILGGLKTIDGPDHLPEAVWYEGYDPDDGIRYQIEKGLLVGQKYIITDMLADGNHMIRFRIILQEGENGPAFRFDYGVLNQCSLRVRLPLSMVDLNRWGIEREGAFLKPRCGGDRVNLENVDRMSFTVLRKSPLPARFCLTDFRVTEEEVPVIEHPVLPKGALIDEIGQSTIHNWPGKTRNVDEMKNNLTERLQKTDHTWPDNMSEWGGWKKRRIDEGTGYFRTHKEKNRWWLIDPDGYFFWSAGVDCVRVDTTANYYLLEDTLKWIPEKEGEYRDIFGDRNGHPHINFLAANYIRTFGASVWREKWSKIALDELKRLRFNTVGNWSDWEYAAEAGFPYVRPMSFNPEKVARIYRDFPDVYHENFEEDAREYASNLNDTKDDPALIGYFMMNEPKWAFSSELPAVGMLFNTESCETRTALRKFLSEKYPDSEELSASWEMMVTFNEVESGKWKQRFTDKAQADLEEFSQIMVEKYFSTLAEACRTVDPNHLNLGIRYAGVPPKWAVAGMKAFDVFSMNCYMEKVPFDQTKEIHDLLNMPVIIGEWHFGALDVGLPASGIGHVPSQEDRGKAYRVYIEDAAVNPYCIGTHWFTLYDQSALGRFDGENYNIGFLDVCNRPHTAISEAAIKSHENIYNIAEGAVKPFNNEPEYLAKLF